MKICKIEYFPVKVRSNAGGGVYWFLLKVSTDDGIDGWGEIIWNSYRPVTLGRMLDDIAESYFIGQDPYQIERLFAKFFAVHCKRHTDLSAMSIFSGIEIALWDIIGKAARQPIYNLMGGRINDKIRVYTYLYEKNDDMFCEEFWQRPDECAARAFEYKTMGFTAVKLDPMVPYLDNYIVHTPTRESLLRAVRTMSAIREAVGEECDIIVGTHGQYTPSGAIQVAKALEPFHPLWFEEPTPPEHPGVLKKVSEATTIPIATGERLSTRFEYAPLIQDKSCDIFQLDLSGIGGILEAKKIAAMAETFHTQITTHFWAGPVNFAAQLQLDVCCPNFLIQESIETMNTFGGFEKVLSKNFVWDNGYIVPPSGPGLGIELDEEKLRTFVIDDYDEKNILI